MTRSGFKIVLIFYLFTWMGFETHAAIGPATPTDNVFTKVKKPESATENLPYDVSAHPLNDEDFDETDSDSELGDTIESTEETEKEIIDWALVPYVPFKRIELTPAPDPKIE